MYDKETQALLLGKGVKCVCQLCDCGRPHKHRGCTKFWSALPIGREKRDPEELVTDYAKSYHGHANAHPPASYRPLCKPRNPNPPPMDFRTVNNMEFKSYGNVIRPQPFKLKGEMESTEGNFEGKSVYRQEYPTHTIKRPALVKEKRATSGNQGVFKASTTYDDVYKSKPFDPNPCFGELPSFTYSVLYPGDKADMKSHSHFTHKAIEGRKVSKINPPPSTIQLGHNEVHDLSTTHRTEFQQLDPSARSRIAKPIVTLQQRPAFTAITQSHDDFKGFRGGMPKRQKAITPPPETIKIGVDKTIDFQTTNKELHKVTWDPSTIVLERSKKKEEAYNPPNVKFDAVSLTHTDFTKHRLSPINIKKGRPKTPMKHVKFDSETSYKKQFPRYGNVNVYRYGDFHESKTYLPPSEKFYTGGSVMTQDYRLVAGKPSTPMKPDYSLRTSGGAFDSATSYGTSFQPVKLKDCTFLDTMSKLHGRVQAT